MGKNTLDEIRIDGLKVYAHHGVYPEETEKGQNFYVNAVLFLATKKAGTTDDLEQSISYAEVALFIDSFMKEHTYKLLETVAEQMAEAMLLRYALLREVEIEIRKPEAPIPLPFSSVSVKIHRKWHRAYIALGSNMGDRENYIAGAVDWLRENQKIRVLKLSDILQTAPYGVTDQADFLNGAMEIETLLTPEELLDELQNLEQRAGRVRLYHWGPRTLDLDILFYDDEIICTDRLTLPHPDMQNRDFVLIPLAQLQPYLWHPLLRKTVQQLLGELQGEGTVKK